jgi:Na+-transporting methylmalonyl-CoA/oxaloacetate decarboxylase gamma subunit
MDLILQGLSLSLTGIVITFASLGLFILIIIVLQRLFGAKRPAQADSQSQGSAALPATMEVGSDSQVAAAIAVALEHFRAAETASDQTGSTLTQGRGAWWQSRQVQAPPVRRPQTR